MSKCFLEINEMNEEEIQEAKIYKYKFNKYYSEKEIIIAINKCFDINDEEDKVHNKMIKKELFDDEK